MSHKHSYLNVLKKCQITQTLKNTVNKHNENCDIISDKKIRQQFETQKGNTN